MGRKKNTVKRLEDLTFQELNAKLDAMTPDDITEDMLWTAAEIDMTIEWGTQDEKAEINHNWPAWARHVCTLVVRLRDENPNGVKGTTYGDICEAVCDNHGWR